MVGNMKWEKKGIIFNPKGKINWAANSALQPTPIIIEDKIRVFFGCRDEKGISRIGWVDLELNDPSKILDYSNEPVLDIGLPGTFDDNGVVPTAVVKRNDVLFLYYAGYQLVKNVRFIAFTGLSISSNNGNKFTRFSNVPVLDRTNDEFLFRAIHSIFFEDGIWKVWYGGGNHFINSESKSLPVYDIRYMESDDGINFSNKGKVILSCGLNEHRIGRPYVIKHNCNYLMFFGASTKSQSYRLAYAESVSGINWQRKDELIDLDYNAFDFDSDMSAYPAVIEVNDKFYMFYNGNDYGKEGFGLATMKINNDKIYTAQ